jgi:hypothetical protein
VQPEPEYPGYDRIRIVTPFAADSAPMPLDRPQQARAYALMAAANLTTPNSRPNADDLLLWRRNVLYMAEKFADYILFGPKTSGGPK